jgi:hypothetical protein
MTTAAAGTAGGDPDLAHVAVAFADPRRVRVLMARAPVTSLRQHTRANALRTARTCYRHLAGQLGVRLFRHMIDAGWVAGGDGRHHPATASTGSPAWITRGTVPRSIRVTAEGEGGMAELLGAAQPETAVGALAR